MNRQQRRTLARETLRHIKRADRITREPIPARKRTHRIPPQACALWIPDARGYLADFSPKSFRVVDCAELARHYTEDEASSAALTFYEVTGLRVAVRPFYPPATH